MLYVIKSKEGFWNNEEGWVLFIENATFFNSKEKERFKNSLPIGENVHWIKI